MQKKAYVAMALLMASLICMSCYFAGATTEFTPSARWPRAEKKADEAAEAKTLPPPRPAEKEEKEEKKGEGKVVVVLPMPYPGKKDKENPITLPLPYPVKKER